MSAEPVSQRVTAFGSIMRNVMRFFGDSAYARRNGEPEINNFALGNPQEMPLQGFADALQKWSTPQNKDWFAYKNSEPEACAIVAQTLRRLLGMPYAEQ